MSKQSKNSAPLGKHMKPAFEGKLLVRVVKMLYHDYPVLVPLNALCIVFAALVSAIPAIFMQKITAIIEIYVKTGDYSAAKEELIPSIALLAAIYVVSTIAITGMPSFFASSTALCSLWGSTMNTAEGRVSMVLIPP